MTTCKRLSALAFLPLFAVFAACSSSSNDTTPTTPAPAPTGTTPPTPGALTVSPASAQVLSCGSSGFKATRDGATVNTASWTASAGTIDGLGNFAAPKKAQSTPVAITATDSGQTASASVAIATAFPQAASAIAGSKGAVAGVSDHAAAAKGKRVYSVWATAPSASSVGISLARSDDGGATFAAAKSAVTTNVNVAGAVPAMDCVSVAIDAGNPDVVYVAGHVNVDNDIIHAATPAAKDQTAFLLVSEDGGGTFKTYPMWGGQSANGPLGGWDSPVICPDVTSPAPNTVVYATPGSGDVCAGSPDIAIWADNAKGAGFATGVGDGTNADFVANGTTRALDRLDGGTACPDTVHIEVGKNGGTALTNGTTESPRLFSDGQGHVCITYVASIAGAKPENTYVQCSDATAKTFSAAKILDANDGARSHSTAVGGFGPNNHAAVAWVTSNGTNDEKLFVAISKDNGATFGAPIQVPSFIPAGASAPAGARTPSIAWDASGVLWVAYAPYDGGTDHIVVDKTCDDGATWSGAVSVDGAANTVSTLYPSVLVTGEAAPAIVSHTAASLQITRLAP